MTFQVRSTHVRNGRQITLDPRFLHQAAAETFVKRLLAKGYGEFYNYEVYSPDAPADPEGDAAWKELGIDPDVARKSRQNAPGQALAPSAAVPATDDDCAPWTPTAAQLAQHQREVREAERKSWAKFEGRDMTQRSTPADDGEAFEDGGCRRCGRTGQFITGMLNGQPTGPGGICFRCNGKGFLTLADTKRNGYRDRHQKVSI